MPALVGLRCGGAFPAPMLPVMPAVYWRPQAADTNPASRVVLVERRFQFRALSTVHDADSISWTPATIEEAVGPSDIYSPLAARSHVRFSFEFPVKVPVRDIDGRVQNCKSLVTNWAPLDAFVGGSPKFKPPAVVPMEGTPGVVTISITGMRLARIDGGSSRRGSSEAKQSDANILELCDYFANFTAIGEGSSDEDHSDGVYDVGTPTESQADLVVL